MFKYQQIKFLITTFIPNNQYNFYVDFKGLMYFDDGTPFLYPNCIKDSKFIAQFYKHLKISTKENFPYLSEFWGQKNYLRCAISPIIYNYLDEDGNLSFSLNQKSKFNPKGLEIDNDGRVWHQFRNQIKGVFSNQLIARCFQEVDVKQNGIMFKYNGELYQIKRI